MYMNKRNIKKNAFQTKLTQIFFIFQSGCRQTRGKLRLLSPSKLKFLRKGLCLKCQIDEAFDQNGISTGKYYSISR